MKSNTANITIDNLVASLQTKDVYCIKTTFIKWAIFTTTYIVILLLIFGIRADIKQKITEYLYLLELSICAISLIAIAIATFLLCSPNSLKSHLPSIIIPPLLITLLLYIFLFGGNISLVDLDYSYNQFQWTITAKMLAIATAPYIALLLFIKTTAPVHLKVISVMAGLVSCIIAHIVLRIHAIGSLPIIFMWCLLPALITPLLLTKPMARLLKW